MKCGRLTYLFLREMLGKGASIMSSTNDSITWMGDACEARRLRRMQDVKRSKNEQLEIIKILITRGPGSDLLNQKTKMAEDAVNAKLFLETKKWIEAEQNIGEGCERKFRFCIRQLGYHANNFFMFSMSRQFDQFIIYKFKRGI